MSVSGISGGGASSIWQQFQQLQASGGASKDDLTKLQSSSQSADSSGAQRIGNLVNNFDTIDLNHDGKLDQSELKTYGQKSGKAGGRHHHHGGPPPGGFTEDQLSQLDTKVKSAGKDDSLLSKLLSSFNDADTNKDGKIDGSEFKTFASANGFDPPQAGNSAASTDATPPVPAGSPTTTVSPASSPSLASTAAQLLKAYASSVTDSTQSQALQGIVA